MKQTNNAIKFLMAQYRAIFKNAYLKGLVSAVVLTTGLAAGAATAQAAEGPLNVGSGANTDLETIFGDTGLTSADNGPFVNLSSGTVVASGSSSHDWNASLTLDGSGDKGTLTIKGDGTADLTITGSGELIIKANEDSTKSGSFTFESAGGRSSSLTLDSISLQSGSLALTATSGTVSVNSKITANSGTFTATATSGDITIDGSALNFDGASGSLTVTSGNITVNSSAISLTKGELTLTGNSGSGSVNFGQETSVLTLDGGTITLADTSGSDTTVIKGTVTTSAEADGTTIIFSGSGGTLSTYTTTDAGAKLKLVVGGSAASGTGVIDLSGNEEAHRTLKIASGGAITATSGSLTLQGSGANNTTTVLLDKDATLDITDSGAVTVSGYSTLGVYANQIDSKAEIAGQLNVDANGTLELLDTEAVTLNNINFAGAPTAGKVSVSGSGTVAGKDFVLDGSKSGIDISGSFVSDTLKMISGSSTGLTAANATFKVADTLSFQGDVTTAAKVELGESGAIATNNSDAFKNIDKLNATSEDKDQQRIQQLLANKGTIKTEDANSSVALGADLTIVNGSWTSETDLTVGSAGKLIVGKELTSTYTAAALNLDGKKLNLSGGSLIVGDAAASKLLSATLDLTGATLSQSGSTINVAEAGELKVTSKQLDALLNDPEGETSSKITVGTDGILNTTGDLELSVDDFNATAAAGSLAISGTFNVGGDLTLSQKTSADTEATLSFGTGSLNVDGLTFNNKSLKLADGTVTVNGDIVSNVNQSTLTVANTLNLGDLDKLEGLEAPSNQIRVDLKVAATTGTVNVNAGNWNVSDTVNSSGTITIGQTVGVNDHPVFDANDEALTASLTANKLVTTAGTVTINQYGSAQFNEVELAGSAGTSTVVLDGGALTINGNKQTDTKTDPNNPKTTYGVKLADDAISVGNNSQLTLGADATDAITLKKADGTTHTTDYVEVAADTFATGGSIVANGGVITFSFDSDDHFNADSLASLRKEIFGLNSGVINGRIDLGAGQIDGINVSGGKISWDDLEGIADTLVDIQNDDLKSAVVTDITSTDEIRGNFGALLADASVGPNSYIQVSGPLTLQGAANNNGKFASNTKGELVGLDVATNASLELINDGQAGDIRVAQGAKFKTSSGDITVKSVLGGKYSEFEVFASNTTVQGDATASRFITDATSSLTINGDLDVIENDSYNNNDSYFDGKLTVKGDASFANDVGFGNETSISGTATFNDWGGIYGNFSAGKVVVDNNGNLEIGNNAVLSSAAVELTKNGSVLSVGEADYYENGKLQSGSTGYMDIGTLTLNGGTLIIDPDYTQNTSIAAIDSLAKLPSGFTANGNYADGNIILAQNSALMIGKDASLDSMKELISQYQVDGHLIEDEVGAVLALNSKIVVGDGNRIIIDPSRSKNELWGYEDADGKWVSGEYFKSNNAYSATYSGSTMAADLYLGKGSVLALSDAIVSEGSAIEFESEDASILGTGGKIVLMGDKFIDSRNVVLFKDQGTNNGVKILGSSADGNDIIVETLNGLMFFTLKAGQETTGGELEFDVSKAKSVFTSASTPIRDNLLAYASRTANYEEFYSDTTGKVAREELTNGLADKNLATYDKETSTITITDAGNKAGLTQDDFVVVDGTLYNRGYNAYLERVTRDSTSGIEGDQAARLATFGGAAQAALTAGATTYDAISGRLGVGAQATSITFADNGQGSGLWVTPVYKSQDSDGFGAQGINYGVDMDLYGLALGADYTLANGLRVGGMFNVGSGDADGQGAGNGVSNDFDYYGFGVYAGYTMDKFSIAADVTYTVVDNDLEVNNMADKLTASTDTSSLSVGVTGQYAFDFNGMSVVPHAGLRYTNIDMDDYTVNGAKFGDIANYSADSMSVFSIPVGVTLSKEIVSGEWTVKPAFDLTLTANMGDDSAEGNVMWSNISDFGSHVESEVVDSFTYGATLGVSAKSGNFSLGFGVNYTGSSNVDEYGLNANARFVF